MENRTIAQVQTEMVNLEEKWSLSLLQFDEYNGQRIKLNREMYSLKMKQEFEWVCQTWNHCPVTFRRIGVEEKIILASSEREARIKLDRHESVIKSIKRR
jgi:hypothetical protein